MRPVFSLLLLFSLISCADPQAPPAPPATATAQSPAAKEPPLIGGGVQVPPFDDARSDPSFVAFRERLQQVVRARDAAALESMLDPRIRVSFGESNGIAAFRKQWRPTDPDSPLWPTLDRILSLGGSFQPTPNGQRFAAPYVYSTWPESIDAFEYLATICHGAVARSAPAVDSKPLGKLEWQALKIGPEDPMRKGIRDGGWRQVILPDGRTAWLESACARSPMDYRAAFEKGEAGWRMVFLVAGD